MAVHVRPYGQAIRVPREGARETGPVRLRVLWILLLGLVLATAVEARLAYWQLAEHQHLASLADAQFSKTVTLPATRGRIFDRGGRPLAVNTTVYSVFLSPEQAAGQQARVADSLSVVLGIPRQSVVDALASDRKFLYIARRQSKDRADRLRDLKLPGVGLQAEDQRSYLPGGVPGATLAANLLGFVNNEGAGQYGVEAFYNGRLAGRAGSASTYRDLANRDIVIGNRSHQDPVNGSDLRLSLDTNIQFAAEQALAAGVTAAKAESGSVLVMDTKTGGILAWADYPTYDANNYSTSRLTNFSSPALNHLYEPGSVMKVVTLAGAMDAGAIAPNTVINDPGGISVGGFYIRDWDTRNHGNVTMTNVLESSLNVGAIRAQQMEGPPSFLKYLQAFGFGAPTGVDVAGETSWPLAPLAEWQPSQLATASFGQGIGVNMLQMTAALNVIPNGGRYAPPHVVERVGASARNADPQRQVVSPETAAKMNVMMQSVVQNGSGWTARVPGFEKNQGGKTGTSQIPVNGQYTWDMWASYAGFLPADNPRFTMLVVVRKPHNDSLDHNEGYYVSAPIWKQIAQQIIFQERITPTRK